MGMATMDEWAERKIDGIEFDKLDDLLREIGEDPEAIDKETGLPQWFVSMIWLLNAIYPEYGDENSSSVSSRI